MTLQIHFTVQDVSDGPAPIDVILVANAGETVEPANFTQPVQSIICNTEGKITGAELRLTFDGDTPPLKVGQIVSLSGHFTAAAPPSDG